MTSSLGSALTRAPKRRIAVAILEQLASWRLLGLREAAVVDPDGNA
jgi:hypothetical protein